MVRIEDEIVVKRLIRDPDARLVPEERQPEQTTLADAALAGRGEDRGRGEVARADVHVDEAEATTTTFPQRAG